MNSPLLIVSKFQYLKYSAPRYQRSIILSAPKDDIVPIQKNPARLSVFPSRIPEGAPGESGRLGDTALSPEHAGLRH